MNKQLEKQLLQLGFKEYKPSSLEDYDRAWQKVLNDEKSIFINVNWYDLSKYIKQSNELPEVEYYCDKTSYVENIKYYGFSTARDIIEIIKLLLTKHE